MSAKLTDFHVTYLRYLSGKGMEVPQKTLARQYGVTHATLSRAIDGRSWKHLPLSPTRAQVHEAFDALVAL